MHYAYYLQMVIIFFVGQVSSLGLRKQGNYSHGSGGIAIHLTHHPFNLIKNIKLIILT